MTVKQADLENVSPATSNKNSSGDEIANVNVSECFACNKQKPQNKRRIVAVVMDM